jgi:hypothetical protein
MIIIPFNKPNLQVSCLKLSELKLSHII